MWLRAIFRPRLEGGQGHACLRASCAHASDPNSPDRRLAHVARTPGLIFLARLEVSDRAVLSSFRDLLPATRRFSMQKASRLVLSDAALRVSFFALG
jgi:hypothetical protein